MRFRIVASSPWKPGNLIVQQQSGELHAFVGSTGAISRGSIHADFFQALLRSKNWRRVEDETWYSLDDLKRQFSMRGRDLISLRPQQSPT